MRKPKPPTWVSPPEAERIARECPTYRDFVDDALFDPAWGYYGSRSVRFGHGAHFDTFPLALSPYFGRMLAEYAHRSWRREGSPPSFELCEVGGGNGQLAADCLLWVWERGRHERSWKRFAAGFRYRIVERSRALAERQRQLLGPLAESVCWTSLDLTAPRRRSKPLAEVGLVFANEVLDCQAHHKIVVPDGGLPGVVYIVPRLVGRGKQRASTTLDRAALGEILGDPKTRARKTRTRIAFDEVVLPLRFVPGLERFLRHNHADLFDPKSGRSAVAFACPSFEPLVRNASSLHARGEVLWIDYGEERSFHRASAAERRVFAGRAGCGHSVYDAPGREDISFLVDFTVVAAAARRAGSSVEFYGPQRELAARSGVRLDRRAADLIVRTRALGWMLAVMGVGPEAWKRDGLGWGRPAASEVAVRDYVRTSIAEFLGRTPNQFKLMILSNAPVRAARGPRRTSAAPRSRSSRGAGH